MSTVAKIICGRDSCSWNFAMKTEGIGPEVWTNFDPNPCSKLVANHWLFVDGSTCQNKESQLTAFSYCAHSGKQTAWSIGTGCVCRFKDNNIMRHWKAGSGCPTKQQPPTIARKVAITAQAVRVPWERNNRSVNSMPSCAMVLQWRRCLVVSYCRAACSWRVAETLICSWDVEQQNLAKSCKNTLWVKSRCKGSKAGVRSRVKAESNQV